MRGCNKWQIWGMKILLLIGLYVLNFSCGLWNWMCAWLSQALLCKFQSQMSVWPNSNCWFDLRTLVAQRWIDRVCLYMKIPDKLLWFVKMHSTKDRDLGACVIWGLSQQGQTDLVTFWEKQYPSKKFKIAGKSCFWQQSLDHCCPPSPSLSRIWISGSIFLCWWWGLSWLIHYYKSVGLWS